MAVVDAGEVVKEGVLEEWTGVNGVHKSVEEDEGSDGGEKEGEGGSAEE